MKIGILTQPLFSNYGGLLQAWALQKTISEYGHEVTIINRVYGKKHVQLWKKIARSIKNEILIGIGKRKRYLPFSDEIRKISEKNINPFRMNRYLGISPELKSNEDFLKYIKDNKFDAYIVGSDQVWRPMYSPNLMTYFLDFVKDNHHVKKIAYAASFGVDYWELTEEQSQEALKLAPLFDVITVRESSGVELVKEHLNCDAKHVLDPTMLRSREDYVNLINNPTCVVKESIGTLFCYVLDSTQEVTETIQLCKSKMGLTPFFCNYITPGDRIERRENISNCIVPPVEQWLKSFEDAEMVITDSFHGTIFSIIFNKPFWVIANNNRGSARFISILKQLGLEDRLVNNNSNIDWKKEINWNTVNSKISDLSEYSKTLLRNILIINN